MTLSIGLQLFSVKNALKQDFIGTIEQLAQIGYSHLEMVIKKTDDGFSLGGDLPPSEVRKQLDRLGLKAVSCHTRVNEETDWEGVLSVNQEIGSTAIGCSIAFFSSKPDVLDFCKQFNKYGEICKKRGLQLYYHNHFQEFQVFEGETVLDYMLKHTDPELVKFELDTYWAVRGGVDPLAWMRKLGDRCIFLHQKDLPSSVQPVNWFEVFGENSHITIDELYRTQDPKHFTQVGQGCLNIRDYLQEAVSLGHSRYVFVEQDATDGDEIEGVATSYRNLTQLLQQATL